MINKIIRDIVKKILLDFIEDYKWSGREALDMYDDPEYIVDLYLDKNEK